MSWSGSVSDVGWLIVVGLSGTDFARAIEMDGSRRCKESRRSQLSVAG